VSIGVFYTLMTLMNWILKWVIKKNTRNELKAEPNDLIVYMTYQKIRPYQTKVIRGKWHTFLIKTYIKFKA
jgi:hypothetical protein